MALSREMQRVVGAMESGWRLRRFPLGTGLLELNRSHSYVRAATMIALVRRGLIEARGDTKDTFRLRAPRAKRTKRA